MFGLVLLMLTGTPAPGSTSLLAAIPAWGTGVAELRRAFPDAKPVMTQDPHAPPPSNGETLRATRKRTIAGHPMTLMLAVVDSRFRGASLQYSAGKQYRKTSSALEGHLGKVLGAPTRTEGCVSTWVRGNTLVVHAPPFIHVLDKAWQPQAQFYGVQCP
jgi:hypothetical protein